MRARRSDTFVGFLRARRLRGVLLGRIGQVLFAEVPRHRFTGAAIASCDSVTESVRIYVMKPFSYSPCAARMVWRELMPRRLPAVCCSVDVVNGGTGRRRYGLVSIDETVNVAYSSDRAIAFACVSSSCTTLSLTPAAVSWPSSPKSLEPAKRRPPSDTMRESNATLLRRRRALPAWR